MSSVGVTLTIIVVITLVTLELTRSTDGRGVLQSGSSGDVGSLPVASDRPFRIVAWNIHRGRDADNVDTFDAMVPRLADADLVALQEVGGDGWGEPPNQARRIAETLGDREWHFAPTRLRWFKPKGGNALVSRHGLDKVAAVSLDSAHRDYRNYLVADLDTESGPVRIIAAHITTREKRLEQLAVVADLFLAQPRAVLLGDLNTRRDSPALEKLFDAPGVIEAFSSDTLAGDAPQREGSDVDWIFVRGADVLDAAIVRDGLSDHPRWHATLRFSLNP